jgi:hypothetical protein
MITSFAIDRVPFAAEVREERYGLGLATGSSAWRRGRPCGSVPVLVEDMGAAAGAGGAER